MTTGASGINGSAARVALKRGNLMDFVSCSIAGGYFGEYSLLKVFVRIYLVASTLAASVAFRFMADTLKFRPNPLSGDL